MRDIIIPDVGDQIGKKIKDPQLKAVAFPVNEPGKNHFEPDDKKRG